MITMTNCSQKEARTLLLSQTEFCGLNCMATVHIQLMMT